MKYSIKIEFESLEELQNHINEMNKQDKKKKNKVIKEEDINNIVEDLKTDNRGKHIKLYHNEAKIYQGEHPELSYKECLKAVYKKQ